MTDDKFKAIEVEKIPKDDRGHVAVNLYVYLPTAGRFVCWVVAGDELNPRKVDALRMHVDPRVFVLESEQLGSGAPVQGKRIDAYVEEFKKVFEGERLEFDAIRVEVITKDKEQELREIYKNILKPGTSEEGVLERLSAMSEDVIKVVAPEVKSIKAHLIRNTKYLNVMNDASAITSLAILFALANGFDSQKSYKELSYAALIMDLSLAEFDEAIVVQHYKDSSQLSADIQAKIRQHPERSHQLASQKLRSLTDITKQLILTHHELHNGKGYPRGVRTDGIFPVARVLSLAVDVFEMIRKEFLNTGQELSIIHALEGVIVNDIEPHLRRHSTRLIQTTLKFMREEETIADGFAPTPAQ